MPRAGWLAAGAVAAAVLAEVAAPLPHVAAALLLSGAAGAAAATAWRAGRLRLSWMAIGVALVAARLAIGLLAAGTPGESVDVDADADRHQAVVLAVHAAGNGQQRAIIAIEPSTAGERAWATLPRYPTVAPTDRVLIDGRLEAAPRSDESGFAEFLARSGVAWTVRGRSLELLPGSTTPAAALEGVRRTAAGWIGRSLPEPEAGLTAAMLIGLRDLVARDVAEDFRTSGLSHVVAISGLHLALLAAVAEALLRSLARRRRSIALLLLIACYSVLAGASPSILRAALMSGVVIVARESGRRGQAPSALALTVLLLVLVDPAAVGDVGFQLSVAATAGLLRWGGAFGDILRARLPARLPGWLVEALAVSLAAQLATLPLVLLHFGRLSLVAPLANLVAAPMVAPSMGAGAAALVAGGLRQLGVPAQVLAPIDMAAAVTVGALVAVARLCAALPLASVELRPPIDVAAAGAAALAVLAAASWRRQATAGSRAGVPARAGRAQPEDRSHHLRTAAVAGLAAVALVVVLVGAARPDGRLRLTVLDVGQGDAILLRGPAGSRMLVDTGPDPDRLLTELDRRLPAWDRRLDLVIVTHPHEDHVAGLALLLDRYRIGAIAEPGMIGLGPGDAAFRRRLAELGRTTRILAAGDRFSFDGVEALVHWPPPGRVPLQPVDGGKDVNNVSIVLELRYGDRRLLLTGDVEEEIDPQLVAAGIAADGPIDVLKVAHHGSGTASTDAFLERLRPQVAVISAGAGNRYGHPSPATVERLVQAGAQLFRTDLDGSVEVATDGHTLTVIASGAPRTAGDDARRPPRVASAGGPGFCPIPGVPRPAPPLAVGSRARRQRAAYNRRSGRPNPRRGLSRAALAQPARVAGGALHGRRRGGRLPRAVRGAARTRAEPTPGRYGGAAA